MIDQLKSVMEMDKDYSVVLKYVYENPYSEEKEIVEGANLSDDSKVQGILRDLANKLIIIELSSQASSNIESRVPKRIYLVNPELENDLENYL